LAHYSGKQRHLISPPVAAKMGIAPDQIKNVAPETFNAIPRGSDYFPEGMFLRNGFTGEISRYSGGQRQWVSVPVGTALGLGANDVVTITPEQYNAIPMGKDYFPEGMLIRNAQTGEIDQYSGGERHWISVQVAAKMDLDVTKVVTISADQFNAIPQGRDYFPEGVFLQNQTSGEISQYSGGTKHWVSAPIAAKLGLSANQLISVTSAQYNAIPRGHDYYPEGIFVQNNQSGEINQVSGGQRHWVSPAAALAIGLTSEQVVIIGADQFNAIPRGGDFVPPTNLS
jgi:hypothetical protein